MSATLTDDRLAWARDFTGMDIGKPSQSDGASNGILSAIGDTVEHAVVAVGRAMGLLDPPKPPESITTLAK